MPKVLQFGVVTFKNMGRRKKKKKERKKKTRWFSHSRNVFENATKCAYNMIQISNIIVCKESNAQQYSLQGASVQTW